MEEYLDAFRAWVEGGKNMSTLCVFAVGRQLAINLEEPARSHHSQRLGHGQKLEGELPPVWVGE